jgi:hypothetical protein
MSDAFWQTRPFQRALAANANTSSFASKIPTITEPTNDGVLNLVSSGVQVPKWIMLMPIGLGANNDGFSMRVLGWRHIGGNTETAAARLWIPGIVAEYACTLGNVTGIASSPVLNTEFFCDTIAPVAARQADCTIAAGTAVQTLYQVISPVNDTPGYALIPIFAWEKIEFQFDQTTNTPTMNVLYAFM